MRKAKSTMLVTWNAAENVEEQELSFLAGRRSAKTHSPSGRLFGGFLQD